MTDINEEFQHLSNGDVADVLASHRLVQTHPRGSRYNGIRLPDTTGLLKLASRRLRDTYATSEVAERPAGPAVQQGVTVAELITDIDSIETLRALYPLYTVSVTPVYENEEDEAAVQSAIARLDARLVNDVLVNHATADFVAAQTTAQYPSVDTFDQLAALLPPGDPEVFAAMLERVKASLAPVPAVDPAEPAVIEDATKEADLAVTTKPTAKTSGKNSK